MTWLWFWSWLRFWSSFHLSQRQRRLAVHRYRLHLLHHHGFEADRFGLFGRFADKIGRRFLLVLTIGGVGLMSLLGGFLPTYAEIGVWSYVIFCSLRY